MFEGFESTVVDTGEVPIFIRRGGKGPPLLLLHGFPETHLMWHRVAPVLAQRCTVICADLRGYGASGKPGSRIDSPSITRSASSDSRCSTSFPPAMHSPTPMRASRWRSGRGACLHNRRRCRKR